MATTLTRNLKLRIDSNLTANSKYNLERLDLLGGTFVVDTTDRLNIRSRTNILIEPESADIDGSGLGGTVTIGTASHEIASLNVYSQVFNLSNNLGLLDQGTSGTKYLHLKYNSTLNGSVDTVSDRTLSLDMDGADRSLVLGGDFQLLGGSITLNLSGSTSVTLPQTGTLSTLNGVEILTNKTINAPSNTITNIANVNIASSAGIAYSKLALSGSIQDSDISASAAIARSKIAVDSPNYVVINDGNGNLYSEAQLSPTRGGTGLSSTATFPTSGIIATNSNTLTFLNKVIDGNNNSLSNIGYSSLNLTNSITNSDIASSAGIGYSKLALSGAITNSDISVSAAIDGTKILAIFGNQLISTDLALRFNGTHSTTLQKAQSGQTQAITFYLPPDTGLSGQVMTTDGNGNLTFQSVAGSGTVTSVALSMPAEFSVAGSPITSAGTFAVTKASQSPNTVFAGPSSGGSAVPTFRSLVAADIPSSIPAPSIADGSVSNVEFQYLDGVTSAIQGQIDGKQPLDSTLTSLAAYNTNGLLTQTAADTFTGRSLVQGAGISISNPDGVAGNPIIASTITQYTDENAQDAVGNILTDTASIDFTYNDAGTTISADVLPAGVDHNQLLNYVANQHVDHTSVAINTNANSGLSGGGTIAASRALVVDSSNAPTVAVAAADLILFADVSNSNALSKTTASAIAALFSPSSFKTSWLTADGTTKTVTHSLGTTDIIVQIFDATTGQTIEVDTETRTDSNTLTLVSSQAPAVSWRILILAI